MPGFNPTKDRLDVAGKVILITGGTAGVGAGTLIALARHEPAHLLFTGRNPTSAASTIARARASIPPSSSSSEVPITFIPADLASLSSVHSAAANLAATLPRLDVLVCNAGIMAAPPALSADGYELQFATNHLGHALLVHKLLPLLARTADARVVMVTSTGWRGAPPGGVQFDRLRTTQEMPVLGRWLRYGQSKLANMLFARELAARYPGVLAFSVTPGVVATGLVTELGVVDKALVYLPNIGRVKTPEEGTHNLLWAVGVPKGEVKPGAFYEPVGRLSRMETKASRGPELAGKLWEWTETELKQWM
ncbi:short-chain dehydrogenase TIC 32, chloroplastic [Staphylotrichum tortipilum]|uniref:Short-chain dehydrogenase TIC 32, chloroplastic n=1 Tax=Staphylotrichum tortipilum TaxID=2831512 RepID=A0AAN6RSA8_9PEZI|nr:short-chain dehydrogenase TIC 32, chloroplastic [Staphylotrichum longicolle]